MRTLGETWTRWTSESSFETGLRALLVLNLIDLFFTMGWVYSGLATEANPVMAEAMAHGPAAFVLSKVFLVLLATALLWRMRGSQGARSALIPMLLLYAFVGGGHVGFALSKTAEAAAPALAFAGL